MENIVNALKSFLSGKSNAAPTANWNPVAPNNNAQYWGLTYPNTKNGMPGQAVNKPVYIPNMDPIKLAINAMQRGGTPMMQPANTQPITQIPMHLQGSQPQLQARTPQGGIQGSPGGQQLQVTARPNLGLFLGVQK